MHSGRKVQSFDLCLKRLTQRAVADYLANEINSAALQLDACVDEILETFECNQPSNAHDSRHGISSRQTGDRKTFEIDSIINTVNFCRRRGTTPAKQIAAVISFGGDKCCRSANVAEKIVAAEIFHEILAVRRDAEWNACNLLEK